MFKSAIPTLHFAFLLCVSTISAGCSSTQVAQAQGPFRPQSIDVSSIPAQTTNSLVEHAFPFDGQTELNLTALRQAVLDRNPTLAAMQSAWQAAIERYPQVTALDDPTFSYGLAPATIGASTLDFGQRFELSQRFPWPGTLRLRGEVVHSEAQAVGEDLNATRLKLIEATDHAFYDYYFVHRAIDINRINHALLLEFQRTTETRYAAGLVPKQDTLQAEVEQQHLAHRGIVLEHLRAITVARMNTLLHSPPESLLPPPPKELPSVVGMPPIATLQAAAVQHQPALRALALQVEARSTDVKLAQLDYFPNLTVSGGYNSFRQKEDLRPMLSVDLNFPLQLGRRHAALREAQAKEQQTKARLEEHRAQVHFVVNEAAHTVQENMHVAQLYADSIVPLAEENLAAARSNYETGITDFLTLITAEKALMLATLRYHEALTNYHKGRAQLERAVGLPLAHMEATP